MTSFISMLRHLGGVGVFILAALDSSVLPTLGAVDALTIVLAARHPELWPYYAMCSTAGSVCGASVAYRLSGLGILHRRIKGAVFDRVTAFLHRFGSLSLSLAAYRSSYIGLTRKAESSWNSVPCSTQAPAERCLPYADPCGAGRGYPWKYLLHRFSRM